MAKQGRQQQTPGDLARQAGIRQIFKHPLFAPFRGKVAVTLKDMTDPFPRPTSKPRGGTSTRHNQGLAAIDDRGQLLLNSKASVPTEQWVWAIAHCLLHLGFDHLRPQLVTGGDYPVAWRAACCVNVNRFLESLKIGNPPEWSRVSLPPGDEDKLYATFSRSPAPYDLTSCGSNYDQPDIVPCPTPKTKYSYRRPPPWPALLSEGIAAAVTAAIAVANGTQSDISGTPGVKTKWDQAIEWFITSYPLLGGLAAGLKVIQDAEVCANLEIHTAAVSPSLGALYLNPHSTLDAEQRRFVVGHELLHAGLRHDSRQHGRDRYYFNVACDFAINSWLKELGVGSMPDSALYDPSLTGLSAEEIYDIIVNDLRRYRKLSTLAGTSRPDVLIGHRNSTPDQIEGVDLDEYYRRALTAGYEFHISTNRGVLPAALEAEIRALTEPPIPWDVQLGNWFDERFLPRDAKRSYARASRRQSSTPDIPRPSYRIPRDTQQQQTFGVVLDTSGSMPNELLGHALGAIASYAQVKDVPAVRVVFCDAAAYDAGYLDPADIAGRVKIKGRGGTVLQPAINLLQSAQDFPAKGPILIITDGYCDNLTVRNDHAYLIPAGSRLPFRPKGPVFRFA